MLSAPTAPISTLRRGVCSNRAASCSPRLSAEQVIVSAPSSAKEAREEQGAEQTPTERRVVAEESPQEPSRPSSRVSNEVLSQSQEDPQLRGAQSVQLRRSFPSLERLEAAQKTLRPRATAELSALRQKVRTEQYRIEEVRKDFIFRAEGVCSTSIEGRYGCWVL